MKGSISISPELHPLNGANAFDLTEPIRSTMNIGPDHIDIEIVDEILPTQVALELDGALDRCKLVSDFDKLVMYANSLVGCISNSVWFLKS